MAVHDVPGLTTRPAPGNPGRTARAAIGAVRGYQMLRSGHVSPCRFTPTCSEYAAQALERHGLARGMALTLRRLVRCHPFGSFGADPVPE